METKTNLNNKFSNDVQDSLTDKRGSNQSIETILNVNDEFNNEKIFNPIKKNYNDLLPSNMEVVQPKDLIITDELIKDNFRYDDLNKNDLIEENCFFNLSPSTKVNGLKSNKYMVNDIGNMDNIPSEIISENNMTIEIDEYSVDMFTEENMDILGHQNKCPLSDDGNSNVIKTTAYEHFSKFEDKYENFELNPNDDDYDVNIELDDEDMNMEPEKPDQIKNPSKIDSTKKHEILDVSIISNIDQDSHNKESSIDHYSVDFKNLEKPIEIKDQQVDKSEGVFDHPMHELNKQDSKCENYDLPIAQAEKQSNNNFLITDNQNEELLGFKFNNDGVLVDDNGAKFEYNFYKDDKAANQKRYEQLGEKITQYIYKLLKERCKLTKIILEKSFFFASENAFKTEDKLLVLIHGSGVVRAGQWSRSVIINENLNMGSQIPYIELAFKKGYEVVVLNTNNNMRPNNPERHGNAVWEKYIINAPAKHIAIVAHSYGGVVVTSLIKNYHDHFMAKVFAIAFTDSVHSSSSSKINNYLQKKACDWVTSNEPIDTIIKPYSKANCKLVSAGDTRHEWTSGKSIESVFKYLNDRYEDLHEKKSARS